MNRPRLMSSCSTGPGRSGRIHRRIHLVAQRADVKRAGVTRAGVTRTDLKRAEVKRTDVKRTDAQLADVKGMGVNGATERGTHVILVPNYYPRPPGRGPLPLARLLRDGYCLGLYCGCSFRFTFYGGCCVCSKLERTGFTRD